MTPERFRTRYGAAGAAQFADGIEIARVVGVKTVAVDTVGAGDAFCAALVLSLRSGAEPVTALHTACASAAVAHASSQPPFRPIAYYAGRS